MEPGEVTEVERRHEGIEGLFDMAGRLGVELDFFPAMESVKLELKWINGEAVVTDGEISDC